MQGTNTSPSRHMSRNGNGPKNDLVSVGKGHATTVMAPTQATVGSAKGAVQGFSGTGVKAAKV